MNTKVSWIILAIVAGAAILGYVIYASSFKLVDYLPPVSNWSSSTPAESESCVQKDGACCLGSNCASVIADCSVGAKPVFKGCDEECMPNFECVADAEDITSALKQLFAAKYKKDISQITINISQQTDKFVRGGVKLGQGGIGEGGNFFAAKVDGNWQLVFDGNGGFSCAFLKLYSFPENMISDCDGTMSAERHAQLYGVKIPAADSGKILNFSNPAGGYKFDYPAVWKVAVNKFNKNNSLFGPGATSASGLGGVEVTSGNYSAADYLKYLQESTEMSVSSEEKIILAGIAPIDAIRYKHQRGYGVIVSYQSKLYNIYINSFNAADLKNFDFIVSSFVLF